ncbi:hypothetical protein OG417_51940 [Actinoallomurus sp. NBC_01490]|uniref:hypothetical protein n=1 Tax=Actinoallomurus sp. NBC_01490 TaxID=2903557 RepID=UPI002E2ED032|nr:hypothetical protein [Actinoallomurus sp. NBC_01490]
MNDDSGLDPDTAERMLRGEPTGPPRLARLLAAASAPPETGRAEGEQAALAAYRAARLGSRARRGRRIPALLSLKAALIGLALLLTGGVAVAATAHHLTAPPGDRRPHHTRTADTSTTLLTRDTPRRSVRPTAGRPAPRPAHPAPPRPRPTPHQKNKTHPVNTPKGKAKGNPHKGAPGG